MTVTDSNSCHLLVVDDDERLRILLQRYLVREGYWCSCARDAAQAARLLAMMRFDLIVMDVMMPKQDGIELTGQIRRTSDIPIIVLSAKTELDDRIKGLRAGADDYVKKPYEPAELIARIEAVLRRANTDETEKSLPVVTFGAFAFDTYRGQLRRSGETVHLTDFELRLLRRLAQTPNRAVSREEFVTGAGGSDLPVLNRAVDVRVSRLRQKLEADPRRPRFLLTVRNEGYMLVPD